MIRIFLTSILIVTTFALFAQKEQPDLEKSGTAEPLTFDEDVSCKPPKLDIIKFQDAATAKSHKVVVGRNIFYRGAPKRATNWQWEFTSQWTTFSGGKYKGLEKIETSDLPVNNDDFGDTYGEVKVSATLEDMPPELLSTDACENWRAQVFYVKNDISLDGVTPNWYYYWKQAMQGSLSFPYVEYNYDTNSYEPAGENFMINLQYSNTGAFSTAGDPCGRPLGGGGLYGRTSQVWNAIPADITNPTGNGVMTDLNITIRLGEGTCGVCGHQVDCTIDSSTGVGTSSVISGTGSTGIECFYQVLEHELTHVAIWLENWGNGWSSNLDQDKDGYNDDWERMHAADGFRVVGCGLDRYDNNPTCGAGAAWNDPCHSVGWLYEERICRNHEDNGITHNTHNGSDWSFMGKQW